MISTLSYARMNYGTPLKHIQATIGKMQKLITYE